MLNCSYRIGDTVVSRPNSEPRDELQRVHGTDVARCRIRSSQRRQSVVSHNGHLPAADDLRSCHRRTAPCHLRVHLIVSVLINTKLELSSIAVTHYINVSLYIKSTDSQTVVCDFITDTTSPHNVHRLHCYNIT